MPHKSLRPCNTIGCRELTREKYCGRHQHQQKQEQQVREKYYDKNIRDERSTKFYQSKEWKTLRDMITERDGGICQKCIQEKQITNADMVHHIVEIKKDWSKRLDPMNLISLCHSCHNKIHGKK